MAVSFAIQTEDAGKKFGRDWIFRKVNERYEAGEKVAILGHNGSGKSTYLMSLSGFYALSAGKVFFEMDGQRIDGLEWYRHYALISPLLELPEDLTVDEFLKAHFELKQKKSGWDTERMYAETGLEAARNKFLKQLSSGMKQRLKLLAAFVPDVPVIFLDEPCTNLDEKGVALYRRLLDSCTDQLVLVASNMRVEYETCERTLEIGELRG